MTIKQFNGSYLAPDDRLLFRFNTIEDAEFRFWFTRRATLFILAATSHLLIKKLEQTHSPDAAKALNEFERKTVLEAPKNTDVKNQAYESGLNFPLGFDPLLVMDVTCALTKNGEKLAQISDAKDGEIDNALSMDFVLPGGGNLNLKLTGNTLQAMCTLLDQLRVQAGWGNPLLQAKNLGGEDRGIESKVSKNSSIH